MLVLRVHQAMKHGEKLFLNLTDAGLGIPPGQRKEGRPSPPAGSQTFRLGTLNTFLNFNMFFLPLGLSDCL